MLFGLNHEANMPLFFIYNPALGICQSNANILRYHVTISLSGNFGTVVEAVVSLRSSLKNEGLVELLRSQWTESPAAAVSLLG
jgi:hypothetical protein